MNNYNASTTGDNIELQVSYDTGLSQGYYDDFIKGYDGNKVYSISSNRETLAYLIGDYDKPYYKKSDLAKMKKSELLELWQVLDFGYNDEYTKSEYISDLLSVTIADYYDKVFIENYFNSASASFSHNYFISLGYSQGDAVYVIDVGADYDVCANRVSISNILWDAPVGIYLSVNDNDELGYELLENQYKYDKDAVIESVNKLLISDNAKSWIAESLPENPTWN